MNFIDEAIITVESGNGGKGCVSFRREKFLPRGGPDGGDGGKGGDVIFVSTYRKRTLHQFQYQKFWKAKNGKAGQGNRKTGKSGEDLIIEIPPGTLIHNNETGELLYDFTKPDETYVAAKGGRGGQGNSRFKTSTHQAPKFAQPGESGITIPIKLDLKLLADVGIVGLPNAGKSTLITAISSAKPKIGIYPFTTLSPHLGVVNTGFGEPFIIADIPGLITGAHKGVGLGTKFLRHIERTRILVHLIDVSALDPDDPLSALNAINNELLLYDKALIKKPQILVLNKMDLPDSGRSANLFKTSLADREVYTISALTGTGIEKLTSKIVQLLNETSDDNGIS